MVWRAARIGKRMLNRGTSSEPCPCFRSEGFTLLELVVVVSVIALFIGLAVPRLPDIAGSRINKTARKVSAMLQLTRSRAVSLRRYYRLEMDMDASGISVTYFGPEGTYIPDEEVRQIELRGGYLVDIVTSSEGKVLNGVGYIRISPRGFIEPAIVHIRDEQERFVTVAPSPVSGRVRIQEGYTDLAVN